MINPVFSARNRAGKLLIYDYDRFHAHLSSLGEDIEVIVRNRGKKQRSSNQNRYYWSVVVQMISDYTGYNCDETHEILKSLFLSEKKVLHTQEGDRTITAPKSTKSLNTAEMEDYLQSVRGFAASEMGLSIPEPGEIDVI